MLVQEKFELRHLWPVVGMFGFTARLCSPLRTLAGRSTVPRCEARCFATVSMQRERVAGGLQVRHPAVGSKSQAVRGVEEDLPENRTVTAKITAAARKRDWRLVEQALGEAASPNTIVYNAAMSAALACGEWRQGVKLYEQLCDRGLAHSLVTYNLAIRSYARARSYDTAVRLGHRMMSEASLWDHVHRDEWEEAVERAYGALADAAGQAGNVEHAQSCLEGVRRACGRPPSTVAFGAAMNACKNARDASAARALLAQMRQDGRERNAVVYTAAMAAHRQRPLDEVEGLVGEMRTDGVTPGKAFLEEHVATLLGLDLPIRNLRARLAKIDMERLNCLDAAIKGAIDRGLELSRLVLPVAMERRIV